jgi:hypothetical protein
VGRGRKERKRTGNNKFQQGCGETGTLVYYGWECTMMQLLCKTIMKAPQKIKNRITIYMIWQFCSNTPDN